MTPPNASATARERARAQLTREIKEEARRQLAVAGADGLSLRAVARSLGMVSSALYRYFPSRDDLLTALIIDAYNSLGEAVETAIGPAAESGRAAAGEARDRWAAACRAVRSWAWAHPHEYTLIYGSPVPGYRAPEATIGPASRVPLAFTAILRDAMTARVADGSRVTDAARGVDGSRVADGARGADAADGADGVRGADGARCVDAADGVDGVRGADGARGVLPERALTEQAARLAAALAGDADSRGPDSRDADSLAADSGVAVPPDVLVRGVIAWTQLFGMVSFELFGQFVGSFDPADAFFEHAVAQMTTFVGL